MIERGRQTTVNRIVERLTDPRGRVFAAIADPTRRAILAALAQKPATVTEIARPFPISLNAVSKHLMVLERAGLIHRKVRGRKHHCRLEAEPLRRATQRLDEYRAFREVRLDALERHVLARKKRPGGSPRAPLISRRS